MSNITRFTSKLALSSVLTFTVPILQSHSENSFWSIIDEPVYYELPSEKKDVQFGELLKMCSDFYRHMDDVCLDRFTEYFADDPIWASSRFEYFRLDRTTRIDSVLNRRVRKLNYDYEDLLIEDPPTWADIFDGQWEQRSLLAANAFDSDLCNRLVGIRPESARECHARQLFKYAAFLDACATAMKRHSTMTTTVYETGKLAFESGLEDLQKRLQDDPPRYHSMVETYTKWNMQVAWAAHICQEEWNAKLQQDEARDLLKPLHDEALRISARAGDEWAIRTYYPYGESNGYWKDLYRIYPSLTHRYLAVGAAGRSMDSRERLQHAVRAYELFKEAHPNVQVSMESYVYGYNHLQFDYLRLKDDYYRLSDAARDLTAAHSQSLPWLWDMGAYSAVLGREPPDEKPPVARLEAGGNQ